MLSEFETNVLKNNRIDPEQVESVSADLVVTMKDGTKHQIVETWSRCMGYYRPMSEYNIGKRQEHADRKLFVEEKAECSCE